MLRAFVRWTIAFARLYVATMPDRFLGRVDSKLLGRQLNRILGRMGGTAITVARHFATRLDLFPPDVCRELRRLVDSCPPMPFEEAIPKIEEAIGGSLDDVFARFDPEPIASVVGRTIYQAVLRSGKKVAVQVTRPEAAVRLDADLRAISWLLLLLEQFTIFRPGTFRNLRDEMFEMISEEIDCSRRAQLTTLYRRQAKKDGLKFVRATRVLRRYVTTDVVVNEFASGYFLYELIAARESGDVDALERFRAEGIDLEVVAGRLLHSYWWGLYENLLYFTSPHPTNIVVQPKNRIVLLDFAESGRTDRALRRAKIAFERYFRRGDIASAAEVMIQSILPLPHIDVHELTKTVELHLWPCYYALRHRESTPFERTISNAWLRFIEVLRERGISVPLETMRMVHSALLYDELASRLWPGIDDSAFWKYLQEAYRRRQVRRAKLGRRSPRPGRALQLQQLVHAGERIETMLESYSPDAHAEFSTMIGKGAYVATIAIKLVTVVGFAVFATYMVELVAGTTLGAPISLVQRVFLHPVAIGVLAVLVLLAARLVFFRLSDLDPGD